MVVSQKGGVPLVIIQFHGIFPYKPTILGYPYLWKALCCKPNILLPVSGSWGSNVATGQRLAPGRFWVVYRWEVTIGNS